MPPSFGPCYALSMAMDNDGSLRDLKKQFIKLALEDGVTNRPAGGAKLIPVGDAQPPRGPNKLELRAQFSNLVEEDGKLPQGVGPYMNKVDDKNRTNLGPDARHGE